MELTGRGHQQALYDPPPATHFAQTRLSSVPSSVLRELYSDVPQARIASSRQALEIEQREPNGQYLYASSPMMKGSDGSSGESEVCGR